jgi:hypothetical protein
VTHEEKWFLYNVELGTTDDELDAGLLPLVKKTDRV